MADPSACPQSSTAPAWRAGLRQRPKRKAIRSTVLASVGSDIHLIEGDGWRWRGVDVDSQRLAQLLKRGLRVMQLQAQFARFGENRFHRGGSVVG